MNREERLQWLKQIEKDIHVCSLESTFTDDAKSCAIHSAIEELEKEACEDAVKSSSENPNKWIPCSERLPEDRDWYLGIFKEPDTGWINPLPFICDYVGSKTKATTKEHWILRGFTDRDECMDYYFNLECVAWQPLPKPYKAEKESEE